MGPYNSTYTRVVPVFNALGGTGNSQWLRQLLALARYGHPKAAIAPDLESRLAAPLLLGDVEKALAPPVGLLRWLVLNLTDWCGTGIASSGSAATKRKALIARDAQTREEALRLLEGRIASSGWQILEGPSYPDVYAETANSILVIEGKRTETSITTSTKWMAVRHQMLRHIDAAYENRKGKRVYGMLIVDEETEPYARGDWTRASAATWDGANVSQSLPHRSREEQVAIAQAYLGLTTWQTIVRTFGLRTNLLAENDRVPEEVLRRALNRHGHG